MERIFIPSKCQNGEIFMNITLERVLYSSSSAIKLKKLITKENIKIGEIGCKNTCDECAKNTGGCLSCKNGLVLDGTECVEKCSLNSPLKQEFTFFSEKYQIIKTQETCAKDCPLGYFKNYRALCVKCDIRCLSCFASGGARCTSCKNQFFLYKNHCLVSCPELTKKEDSTEGKSCVSLQNSQTTNIEVKISPVADEKEVFVGNQIEVS